MGFWSTLGQDALEVGVPPYGAYEEFYKKPADKQKAALQTAQGQAAQYADYNRQLQLEGLNRAESFYGPARDVLSQMLGGVSPAGFGATTQGPTSLPTPPTLPGGAPPAGSGGWQKPPAGAK